ncbi:MarR family transcriptional regulator [Allorhizobium sp. BGMRC 0089]|uniref:MarR family winged helix-turn-helix transcriptional regulator n=1 Tax=Allorhizobium sonneratiae TaxID=2934936 RepID=UPI002033C62D|nr:MarR family transcriptional regulator [Allorhizobium sonneratiae]MCM2292664.1 MarR family transcriptional regulator [Allorhizobium sonneratiae]
MKAEPKTVRNAGQNIGQDAGSLSKNRLRLWLKLLKSAGLVEDEIRRRLRQDFSTTLPRFDVMSALSRAPGGLKMKEISHLLRVSNGNITGIVDKLCEDGFVLRVTPPDDRRTQIIVLTPKGRSEFDRQAKAHEGWIDAILGGLDADDVDGMIRRLDHLTHTLEEGD